MKTDIAPTDTQDTKDLSKLRRHDLVVSCILWVVSLIFLLESIGLTFDIDLPGIEKNAWLVAPGFMPMFFSGGLLFLFSILIGISIKDGQFAGHFTPKALKIAAFDRDTLETAAHMVLLCIYVFGLVGRVQFGVASALYLFAAMSLARAAKLYQIGLISVIFSAAITYIFGSLIRLPLP